MSVHGSVLDDLHSFINFACCTTYRHKLAGEVGWSMLQGTHRRVIDTIVEVELSTHQRDDLWINEAEHEHDFEASARDRC